jgi:hypothetical protein
MGLKAYSRGAFEQHIVLDWVDEEWML